MGELRLSRKEYERHTYKLACYLDKITDEYVINEKDLIFLDTSNITLSDEEKRRFDKLGAFWIKEIKKYAVLKNINYPDFIVDENEVKKLQDLRFDKYIKSNHNEERFLNIEISNLQSVSVKIGKEVFGNLLEAMLNAKKRVYVCSPYYSLASIYYFKDLKEINPNLDLRVLFSTQTNYDLSKEKKEEDSREDKCLKELIEYNIEINSKKKTEREEVINKLENERRSYNYYIIALFVISFILIFLVYKYNLNKFYYIGGIIIVFLYFLTSILSRISKVIENLSNKRKYKEFDIRTIYYRKKPMFNFIKVISSNPLLHTKFYIIDNVVYLGSLNFSNNALFYNLESLIKIEDKNKLDEFIEYFNILLKSFNEINYKDFGKYLYNDFKIKEKFLKD